MRLFLALSLLLGTLGATFGHVAADDLPAPPRPGTFTLKLRVDNFDREATVHIPARYQAGAKPPLVLAFHGAGGSGPQMLDRNGWRAKADKEGFLVVAPTGLPALPRVAASFQLNPNLWNSGQLNPRSPRAQIDDVRFTAQLLDELKARLPYDERRVFVTGHSNGAGMTFRVGTELSARFAALAPVSGMLAVNEPRPAKPLRTLYIVGTKDPLQPLEGGEVSLPWGNRTNVPVAEYLTAWARAIGCQTKPAPVSDVAGVKKVQYPSTQPDGPALVVLYIEGHGHEWPGGDLPLPERLVGPKTNKLNATDAIWDFFRQTP